MFITDHIAGKDFFKYDTLYTTTFYEEDILGGVSSQDSAALEQDSLLSYNFQIPIHPSMDFQASNYDSLYYAQLPNELTSVSLAKEHMNVSSARFQLTNRPKNAADAVFQSAYSLLLPRNLNISLGTTLSNQFNTKAVSYTHLTLPTTPYV